MGFGLGFCCCQTDCRIKRPYLSARTASVDRTQRILGEAPWQNTLILIETYANLNGVPTGARIPNPGYAGVPGLVVKYLSQDTDAWYYTRDDEGDGIGAVLRIRKATVGETLQHGIDLSLWDDDYYANYVYDAEADNLVSVVDESLEAGRRKICPRSESGLAGETFALVPFVTLARWLAASKPNSVTATISNLPNDSRDCDTLLQGNYSSAVQPSVSFGVEIDRYVYSPATIANTCRGPNHGGDLGGVNWCRPHVPLVWLDSVSNSLGHVNGLAPAADVRVLWADAFYDRADPEFGSQQWVGRVRFEDDWPGNDPDFPDIAIAAALPFVGPAGGCITIDKPGAIDALEFSVV